MTRRFDPALLIASLESEGFRRADIARAANLNRSIVTRLANREVRRPSYDSVEALQRAAATLLRSSNRKGLIA